MDIDIRDMFADDDLFDPFEEEEEVQAEVTAAAADEEGVVPAPVELPKAADKPALPPEERIANLLKEMPGQKKLLLRLIDRCREPKTGEEMDEYTLELQRHCYSVYSPVILRELLEEAGAIEYIPMEDGGEGEGEGAEAADASDVILGEAPQGAESKDLPAAETYAPKPDEYTPVEGGVLVAADESKVKHEQLIEGDTEMVLDYLEVEEAKPGFWQATAAGVAAVDAVDSKKNTEKLLAREPQYLDIYHQILDFCAQEQYGRSSKEIDNLVNDSPLLEKPRRYSGYFVSRLEREGALEWMGGWCITDTGRAVMEEYAAKAADAAAAETADEGVVTDAC